MRQSLQLTIKSSFLDRARLLTLDSDFIEFDDKDLIVEKPTRFDKIDIAAFRYGIKWISGYQFTIGRIYCIDIKSADNRLIKIRLKSLYGVNKQLLTDKYVKIIEALYDNYFDEISLSLVDQFNQGKLFNIEKTEFNSSGIKPDSKKEIIRWEDIGTKPYSTYFTIFSKSNPNRNKSFEYISDWNVGVLYSVSRQILINKGLIED